MQIVIKHNIKEMTKSLTKMEQKVIPQATNRTLNRVGSAVSKAVMRDVAKQAGLSQRDLKKDTKTRTVKSRFTSLAFRFTVLWGAIPLKRFKPTRSKTGVKAKAWGKSKVYDGAFIVDSMGSHVYKRTSDKRTPIKKLYGPTPARLAMSEQTESKVQEVVDARLGKEFMANLRYYLSRMKPVG